MTLGFVLVLTLFSCAYGLIFLLVDLRDFFSDLGSGGGGGKAKISCENDQLTSHDQSVFLISQEQSIKLGK